MQKNKSMHQLRFEMIEKVISSTAQGTANQRDTKRSLHDRTVDGGRSDMISNNTIRKKKDLFNYLTNEGAKFRKVHEAE